MINADKYLNLDLSVINISSKVIKNLQEYEVMNYDQLLISLQQELNEDVKEVFIDSINFLFLLGKIEYLDNLDAFRLKDEA